MKDPPLPLVSLRPLAEGDLPYLSLWLEEGWQDGVFLGEKPTPEAAQNLLLTALLTQDIYLAILSPQQRFLGMIGLKDVQETQGEFFISLLRAYQGQGYALAAGKRFLSWLKAAYPNICSIHMFTFQENEKTIRYNLRMGFTPTKDRGETVAGRPICRFTYALKD